MTVQIFEVRAGQCLTVLAELQASAVELPSGEPGQPGKMGFRKSF